MLVMTETNALKTKPALIVVDVQASFPARSYYVADDVPTFLAAQNRLISGFINAGAPVVRVFHVEESGAFSLASGLVRPFEGLMDFAATHTVEKHAHSAFAGTSLAAWLTSQGIMRIAVSGIRTEQCCETTTRDASDRGLLVDFVAEATLTFPMTHANGRVFSATDIRERTELVLADRFANIVSVDEALARI